MTPPPAMAASLKAPIILPAKPGSLKVRVPGATVAVAMVAAWAGAWAGAWGRGH